MAESVKCLSSEHRDLSSVSQKPWKQSGMVVCVCNSSTSEEIGRSWNSLTRQHHQLGKFPGQSESLSI